MMAELKDAWVKTAKSFVLAANDFVNAVADSAKTGRDQLIKWAQSDNDCVNTMGTEIPKEDDKETPDSE